MRSFCAGFWGDGPRVWPWVVLPVALSLGGGCGAREDGASGTASVDDAGGSNPNASLHVVATEPDSPVSVGAPVTLFVRFLEPVVAAGQVGQALDRVPLRTEPPLELKGKWVDCFTLMAEAREGVSEPGRVVVRFSGELSGKTDRPGFSFFVRIPRVKTVWVLGSHGIVENEDYLPTNPTFRLRLSRENVDLAVVQRRCGLEGPGGSQVPLRFDGDGRSVDAIPTQPLTEGTDYTLRCRGMGDWDRKKRRIRDFVKQMRAAPPFRVVGVELIGPDRNVVQDADPDDVRVRVRFSAPVGSWRFSRTAQLVQGNTKIVGSWLRSWESYTDDTSIVASAQLDGPKRYTLVITEDLEDDLGRPLSQTYRFEFRTRKPRPAVKFQGGRSVRVLDVGGPGFEVASRLLDRVLVRCARVPRAKWVSALFGRNDWGDLLKASRVKGLSWRERKFEPGERWRGSWKKGFVDVASACGRERGLFVLRIGGSDSEASGSREEGSGEAAADGAGFGVKGSGIALVNVTDLGVFLKVGATSSLVWVVRLSDGSLVAGARVAVHRAGSGRVTARAQTDAEGIARLPGARRLSQSPERLWVAVESGGDVAVLKSTWSSGIAAWNFLDSEDDEGSLRDPEKLLRGFLQTDRGLYRPGEKVNFHGYVRVLDKRGRLTAGPRRGVAVRVFDSKDRLLVERKLRLSPYGSFAFSSELAKDAPLGHYRLEVRAMDQSLTHTFRVEEFRRATVELKVRAEATDLVSGSDARVRLQANFLHGAPVVGGRVRWTVERKQWFPHLPSLPDGFSIADEAGVGGRPPRSEAEGDFSEREAHTDERGEALLSWATEQVTRPYQLIITGELTPEGERPVTKQVALTVHAQERYVGIRPEAWVVGREEPLHVGLALVSFDGKPLQGTVRLQVRRCVKPHPEKRWSLRDCLEWKQVVDRPLKVGRDGFGDATVRLPEPGTWVLVATAKDGNGREVLASETVWVPGRGMVWWADASSENRMALKASKEQFEPGETATLLPLTDLKGTTALLTLEQRGVSSAQVLSLPEPGVGLQVRLRERDAPVVYAGVLLLQPRRGPNEGPRFQMGVAKLSVSPERWRLRIQVEPRSDVVEPGDAVQVRLKVSQADGSPSQAELAVAVVDEGVLQVAGYRTPDPLPQVYQKSGWSVRSSVNLLRVLRSVSLGSEECGEGCGADTAPRRKRQRKRFPPLAYWNPRVQTDERGEAVLDFKAPDGLTAYRIMVVGADRLQRFGSGEGRVTVSKDLMVEPSFPRFVRPGDTLQIPVAVSNRAGRDLQVKLRGWVRGASIEPRRHEVSVPAGGRVVVRFTLKGVQPSAERLAFRFVGRSGALEDDVASKVPVRLPILVEHTDMLNGFIRGTKEVRLPPVDGKLWSDEVSVRLDLHGLGALLPALEYLIRYPYGCLEQTLSRTMPLLAARELGELLGDEHWQGGTVEEYLRAGVARIPHFQRFDGAFRLWPEEHAETYLDLSALAVWGLYRAKVAGFDVDEAVLSQGIAALRRWSLRESQASSRDAAAALAAFVLSRIGKPVPELEAKLLEEREQLSVGELVWLWASLAGRRDQTARRNLAWLRARVGQHVGLHRGGALVRLNLGKDYDGWRSDVRITAVALLALLKEKNRDDEMAERLAAGLLASRESGRWGNTQATFWAISALLEHARTRVSRGGVQVRLRLGDQERELTIAGGATQSLRLPVPSEEGTLRVDVSGGGEVFVSAIRETRLDAMALPAHGQGFQVKRRYEDVQTGREIDRFRLGQLVRVVVDVQYPAGGERRFLAAVSPLPAGLEPVDTSLATEQVAAVDRGRYSWEWDFRELRDDRVQAFRDRYFFGNSTLRLQFLARATTVGRFVAPGAHAEAMYRPSIHGRTAGGWVEVFE